MTFENTWKTCFTLLLAMLLVGTATATEQAPWGGAEAKERTYAPQKVVYDVAVADKERLTGVIDRASYLNNIYQADPFETSIVLVLHGDEVPYFAISNLAENKELMTRAQSLTVGGTVEFRMCELAALARGLKPEDIHGFVTIVPMADAEIIRLQQEDGYVYMR